MKILGITICYYNMVKCTNRVQNMTALSSVVAEQFSWPTNLSLGVEEMGLGIVATSLRHLWHRGNGKLRPQK
jgi:hypothetical protein